MLEGLKITSKPCDLNASAVHNRNTKVKEKCRGQQSSKKKWRRDDEKGETRIKVVKLVKSRSHQGVTTY